MRDSLGHGESIRCCPDCEAPAHKNDGEGLSLVEEVVEGQAESAGVAMHGQTGLLIGEG